MLRAGQAHSPTCGRTAPCGTQHLVFDGYSIQHAPRDRTAWGAPCHRRLQHLRVRGCGWRGREPRHLAEEVHSFVDDAVDAPWRTGEGAGGAVDRAVDEPRRPTVGKIF